MPSFTRSGRRFRPDTPVPKISTAKNKNDGPDLKLQLYMVRFEDGPLYKHWALWVEYPKEIPKAAQKHFAVTVRGSPGTLVYKKEPGNAREQSQFLDEHCAGSISIKDAARLEAVAKSVEIRNNLPTWNCQNYVLELLGELDNQKIMKWRKGMSAKAIHPMMDGPSESGAPE